MFFDNMRTKNYKSFKFLNTFLKQTKGQKRLFLFCGLINVLITNFLLQLLLSYSYIPTSTATFISQVINMLTGYLIYSKLVFKNKRLLVKKFIIKYMLLMIIIWLTNFYCIKIFELIGFVRNISALILIPFLATISFILQRYFVFKG